MHYSKGTAKLVLEQLNLPFAVMRIFEAGGRSVHSNLSDYKDPAYLTYT
ncbi:MULTISPECIES: hypothetical protein [unclassified Paenibacillus]